MLSLREHIHITELQVISKYPFWAYRHHAGDNVYLCVCWSAGCIYLLVHRCMFYCTGLFQTTQFRIPTEACVLT